MPFHQRGTGGDSKAPRHMSGRPEIIHEDGPPVPHSQIEAGAGAGKEEMSARKRGVEIIDDEGPTPLHHQYDPQDGEGGSRKDEAMQNAYLFMRYLLWVLTGIPPPSDEGDSGATDDEDHRPASIPGRARPLQEEDGGSVSRPSQEVATAGTSLPEMKRGRETEKRRRKWMEKRDKADRRRRETQEKG